MDEDAKCRYDMILGRYLLTDLGLDIKISEHLIEADSGPLKGSKTPMVNLGPYEFNILNTGEITPEESFINTLINRQWCYNY